MLNHINEVFAMINIIFKLNIPNNLYSILLFLFLTFKFKNSSNLHEVLEHMVNKYKNIKINDKDYTFENICNNQKIINNFKEEFENKINKIDISIELKAYNNDTLKEILKNNYISNISEYKNKPDRIKALVDYYDNFGLNLSNYY